MIMKNIYLLFAMIFIAVASFGQTRSDRAAQQIKDDGNRSIYLNDISYDRGVIEDCPAGSLGGQGFDEPSTASTSEVPTGYTVATEFSTIGGTIETVHVWMASMFNDGSAWSECTPADPYTVNIYFVENDGGTLGDTLHSFEGVTATVVDAGVSLFGSYSAYLLSVDLTTGVDMTNGFLIVEGTSDDSCWFMWIDAPNGSGSAFQYDGTAWGAADNAFTYCLEGIAPACAAPQNLALINPTDVSLELSWDQSGSPDSWDIEVVESGTAATGTPTETGIVDNPYTIEGLTAGTIYDVYIRSNCGGGDYSDWAGPATGNTLNCEIADQCGYVVDLVDDYGDGWNGGALNFVEDGVTIATVTITGGDVGQETVNICDGGAVDVVFVAGSWPSEIGFTISDPNGVELYSAAIGDFAAEDDGTTVYSFTGDCTPPACPRPEDLTATTGLDNAVLAWTEMGTADTWNIEWGAVDFTLGEGTLIEGTMDNPYTLEGLTSGTVYDYYVQADCGAETSMWAGPFTFTTDCEAITSLPYVEDFESGIACWTIDGINANETWYLDESGSAYEGAANIACNYDAALEDQDEYIISNEFDLSGVTGDIHASFYWKASYNWAITEDNYNLSFEVSTDGGTVWNPLWDLTDVGVFTDFNDTLQIVDLSTYAGEASVHFAFHYVGNDGAAAYVDLFEVDFGTNVSADNNSNIAVYPNPANNVVTIENAENAQITIVNMVGQVVASQVANSNRESINISDLSNGTYVIRIENGNEVSTQKLNVIR
jgi:hypothetical protein